MVLVGCVLALAAFGSWMLLRPGAAPVAEPVHPMPFQDTTSSEPAPSTPALAPQETPLVAENAPVQAVPAPLQVRAAPVVPPPAKTPVHETALPPKKETAPAEKASPPPPPKTVTATLAPPAQPPSTSASTALSAETARPETAADAVPLPLAPPRLEPLPVGSDAARPRMSPDVFVARARWGSFVELGDVDKPPVAVSRPAPVYPPAARQMRRQGEIEMRLLIDAQGQVAAVELLTGGRSDFAMAAERAARLWKYRPAMKDGVPVQVKIVEKVAFKL